MIIFDTNVLYGLSPDDPKFDLLRALEQSGQQHVGIPWMVQEELVAQRVLAHAKAHEAAVSATRDLNRIAPWLDERGPKPFHRSEACDYWRQAYGRLFEILETSGDVARRALLREANCEKPAKGPDAKDKGGARDAAIWLSVIEYLKANPDENVCFVTANTRDFADGSEFPAPMAEDIKGLEDRLTLLTSFDSVVSEFSTPLDIDEAHIEKDLASLLTSEAVRTLLAKAGMELLDTETGPWGGNAVQAFLSEFAAADTYPQVNWNTWTSEPKVVLRHIRDVAGHKIGEDAWYTATVDWILVGLASAPNSAQPPRAFSVSVPTPIACQWRTKLLFSSRPEEPPVLLQYWPPEPLDLAEQDEWRPLVNKAMPQITTPQLFTDFPSGGGPRALAMFAMTALSKRRQEGGATGSSGHLFEDSGDTATEDDDPAGNE